MVLDYAFILYEITDLHILISDADFEESSRFQNSLQDIRFRLEIECGGALGKRKVFVRDRQYRWHEICYSPQAATGIRACSDTQSLQLSKRIELIALLEAKLLTSNDRLI